MEGRRRDGGKWESLGDIWKNCATFCKMLQQKWDKEVGVTMDKGQELGNKQLGKCEVQTPLSLSPPPQLHLCENCYLYMPKLPGLQLL